jgi:hypothetical protein
LSTSCKAPASSVQTCNNGIAAANAATKGQAQADAFNAVFGGSCSNSSVSAATNTTSLSTSSNSNSTVSTSSLSASNSTTSTKGLDFGKCTNPAIAFGLGFDGRTEDSFEPADRAEFNHASALNIVVITGFINDRLNDECAAPEATKQIALQAATAANALKGQAAADSWNNALGVTA